MREAHAEDARSEAKRLILDLLGEERPTAGTLLKEAQAVLGRERTRRAADLARGAPLTRRSAELAAIAALFVGTGELGAGWWTVSRGGSLPPPEEVLVKAQPLDPWADLTVLEMLAAWISDDVADAIWGPPAGSADLNSWQAEDRVQLPEGVRAGTRLVVSFDAGGRLDAVVVTRKDDDLGSNLDFSSLRYSRPAEAQWSWGVAAGLGPHPLPDELPDPYADPVDQPAATVLREWALQHGATPSLAGPPWANRGDVIAAVERVDWMWRSAEWFAWWRATAALIDAEPAQLDRRLEDLAG
ncbi:hypothetical protein Aph01nite_56490 [Acrocarpospora phusangensis]|uniref:Uncharacterized protein n=1 Tax=Acrocarpospora phusangensis TaxID=1070424 RepID=A0A919QGB3_9ACTN|nr:hypothetical protein [Acrocarpospora phusangensis]GIH27339.1 hypothetical protein Aph01nite_56490 [Acrocarpospora phusangensis]